MSTLTGLAAAPTLQQCKVCDGYTLLLRADRCLICHRNHLADSIDRDAKDDAK